MSVRDVIVIPARLRSTRLPEKALHPILGKPLLQWVIEGVKQSKLADQIIVATDDPRLFEIARSHGVMPVMTDSDLPSGTDRVRAALAASKLRPEFVLNVQGDEPLIQGETLDRIIEYRRSRAGLQMMTLGKKIQAEEVSNPNVVKVLLNSKEQAIYFSRFAIPFSRVQFDSEKQYQRIFKHVGLYGYTPETLERFCNTPVSEIESHESLEQLRALDLGIAINVTITEDEFHGVDTLHDVAIVESHFKKMNLNKGR
jgi:3-deoxy-manno-octulosonate cytidylyltransferase (CMP-KDO synthetase)